ncbi:ECF RNA polymerase sigma factor SigK [Kitasatospora sp. NPDC003701]
MSAVVHLPAPAGPGPDLKDLLARVARGDREAFSRLYDAVARPVPGLVRRVLRDPAQSEEVAQEVLLDVWRGAARYRADRGEVVRWVLTIAHRRAVDGARAARAAADRDRRAAAVSRTPDSDEVAVQVEGRLEREQVRCCLRTLTELRREALTLAYYRSCAAPVAGVLGAPLGTIRTRMRDGLIRLCDCLGVGE